MPWVLLKGNREKISTQNTKLGRWDPSPTIEGAPARNQNAITASKIMQPNDDVGMKGQIGLPQRWWMMSQQECMSHASPMNR